ncbi:hypothetical protein GN956_G4452 [Arapaima gigas]
MCIAAAGDHRSPFNGSATSPPPPPIPGSAARAPDHPPLLCSLVICNSVLLRVSTFLHLLSSFNSFFHHTASFSHPSGTGAFMNTSTGQRCCSGAVLEVMTGRHVPE